MKTTDVTPADIARFVWAVPPLALTHDARIDSAQNRKLVRHIEGGGVKTILWGGNANIYAMRAPIFRSMIEQLPEWVERNTWAIPSVGPDYGRLMDHAEILKGSHFPAVVILPYCGPRDCAGIETAIRKFVRKSGIPVILYLRQTGYLPAGRIGALVGEGLVVAIKYAVETGDFTADPYLDAILAEVPRDRIVSGIGEIAAVPHLTAFGLAGFTAGAVCIAPRRGQGVLRALHNHDKAAAIELTIPINDLENLREAHGAISVIHEAVTLSGIADMGRITPHFSPAGPKIRDLIAPAAQKLLHREADFI